MDKLTIDIKNHLLQNNVPFVPSGYTGNNIRWANGKPQQGCVLNGPDELVISFVIGNDCCDLWCRSTKPNALAIVGVIAKSTVAALSPKNPQSSPAGDGQNLFVYPYESDLSPDLFQEFKKFCEKNDLEGSYDYPVEQVYDPFNQRRIVLAEMFGATPTYEANVCLLVTNRLFADCNWAAETWRLPRIIEAKLRAEYYQHLVEKGFGDIDDKANKFKPRWITKLLTTPLSLLPSIEQDSIVQQQAKLGHPTIFSSGAPTLKAALELRADTIDLSFVLSAATGKAIEDFKNIKEHAEMENALKAVFGDKWKVYLTVPKSPPLATVRDLNMYKLLTPSKNMAKGFNTSTRLPKIF